MGGNVISYGGLINVITKKPYEQLGGELNYIGGSNNLNRVSLDINTPIHKKLFIRLNPHSALEKDVYLLSVIPNA